MRIIEFFLLRINDWFNDILPRKTGSNSQALKEQQMKKTLSAP